MLAERTRLNLLGAPERGIGSTAAEASWYVYRMECEIPAAIEREMETSCGLFGWISESWRVADQKFALGILTAYRHAKGYGGL